MQVLAPGQSERYFRARIVNFSEREAEKACRALHKKHLQCAVVAPGPTQQMAANTARQVTGGVPLRLGTSSRG